MSNFGFTDLRLVKPYTVAYREAKSAVKSAYILENAQVHESIEEAVTGCTLVVGTTAVGHRDLHVPLYRLETAGPLLRAQMQSAKAALLFGSEKFGLSNDDMSYCHWLTRIPARPEHASMNLGQAVAVCCYELSREEAAAKLPAFPPPDLAPAEDLERLSSVLMDLLMRSGYAQEQTSESTELKVRRLVRRLQIPEHDSEVLLGMLRQALWKLRSASGK